MTGEDATKFKEMCEETGEPWLKKFAEMTGTIQYLDDNTTAVVGTNGTAIKSKDGKVNKYAEQKEHFKDLASRYSV